MSQSGHLVVEVMKNKKFTLSSFRIKGRLLCTVPSDRYRLFDNGKPPEPGDIIGCDQGFTGDDGQPMTLVYHFADGCKESYEAELYDSEFELITDY